MIVHEAQCFGLKVHLPAKMLNLGSVIFEIILPAKGATILSNMKRTRD